MQSPLFHEHLTPLHRRRAAEFLVLLWTAISLQSCGQSAPSDAKTCAKGAALTNAPTALQGLRGVPKPLTENSDVMIASKRQIREHGVIPASYIVAFRSDLGTLRRKFHNFTSEYQHFYPSLAQRFLGDPRVADLDYITEVDLVEPAQDAPEKSKAAFGFGGGYGRQSEPNSVRHLRWGQAAVAEMPALITKVEFSSPTVAEDVLREWEESGEIWFAHPNELSEPFQISDQVAEDYGKAAATATFGYHKTIRLPEALKLLAQAKDLIEPVIAVLDSGVDYEHPLLKDRLWVNPQPGAAGCGQDVYGCDLTATVKKGELGTGSPYPYDTTGPGMKCPPAEESTCGHGTHVSGIIVAQLGNNVGGVCPVCKVMPLKIIAKNPKSGKGSASDDAILKALKYLTVFGDDNKRLVRVANSSFGKYTKSRSVGLLVSVLKRPPFEMLVIGAAGNDGSMARSYPAAFSEAVAVASIASEGAGNNIPLGKNSYSNFGPWVDISAPGGTQGGISADIVSTFPGGIDRASQGTSMAAPVVAGVAGLVVAMFKNIGFSELRDRVVSNGDPRIYGTDVNSGINYSCYNPKFGSDTSRRKLLGTGVVDAEKALSTAGSYSQSSGYDSRVGGGCGVVGSGGGGAGGGTAGGGARGRSAKGGDKTRDLSLLILMLGIPTAVATGVHQKMRGAFKKK